MEGSGADTGAGGVEVKGGQPQGALPRALGHPQALALAVGDDDGPAAQEAPAAPAQADPAQLGADSAALRDALVRLVQG